MKIKIHWRGFKKSVGWNYCMSHGQEAAYNIMKEFDEKLYGESEARQIAHVMAYER